MSGYLLILAIIFLGGAIATIGDRLGSRVGKARLSLFKMRPKQTAVLVTILTGSVISSLTLGILLATSQQLRDGLIRIGDIRKQSRQAEAELKKALAQKESAETELTAAQDTLDTIVDRLRNVRSSLRQSVKKQQASETKLKQLQVRFSEAQSKLKQTESQTKSLRAQLTQLDQTSQQLKQEQSDLIEQRNQAQQNLSAANAQRIQLEGAVTTAQSKLDEVETQKRDLEDAIATAQVELDTAKQQEAQSRQQLAEAESQLTLANNQRSALLDEIQDLEENRARLEQSVLNLLVGLRQGSIALRAGQVLSSTVIQDVQTSDEAIQSIQRLQQQARIEAIVRIDPPDAVPNQSVIFIPPQLVDRMVSTLQDGNAYFVRLISANNYFAGEGNIRVTVIPQILPNQRIFKAGDVLSTVEFVPAQLKEAEVISRVESLFGLAKQRAIQSGIPPDPLTGEVGEFSTFKLFKFASELNREDFSTPIQVYAVSQNNTFTAGPLQIELIAVQNDGVVLRSN